MARAGWRRRRHGLGDRTGLTTGLHLAINDYGTYGTGTQNGDTSAVRGPTGADSAARFGLDAPRTEFDAGQVRAVEVKTTFRLESAGVVGALDRVAYHLQLFDGSTATALSEEILVTASAGTAYLEARLLLPLLGTPTLAQWNGAELRVRQDVTADGGADGTARLLVSALALNLTMSGDSSLGGDNLQPLADAIRARPAPGPG